MLESAAGKRTLQGKQYHTVDYEVPKTKCTDTP
jgi:hypothetical protein